MRIKRSQVIVIALILLGLTFLVIGVLYQQDPTKFYAHSLRTWQEADSVAGYPIPLDQEEDFTVAEFQPNLSTLTPMERFRLPVVRGFSRQTGKNARAVATGLVLYSGKTEGYPGHTVLIGHRLPNRSIIQTLYTGLTAVKVLVGQQIPRGKELGTGGALTEVREGGAIDVANETIAGHTLNHHAHPAPANRLDLDQFFAQHGLDDPGPDPLAIIHENQFREAREKLQIQTQ